jgi:hypothetical protein
MSDVFTNPSDLTRAIVAKVNPQVVMVPTIAEQMTDLIKPGRAIGFRTESGSQYELTLFVNRQTVLYKINEKTDRPRAVATGELRAARDRKRGVCGVMITQPNGRVYTTSAIVKIWLAYDAIAGTSHHEPA